MKTIFAVLFLLVLFSVPTVAQVKKDDFFKPFGKSFVVSTAVYGGGATADVLTSRGKLESNPLSRDQFKVFDTKKNVALKAGVYGVSLLFEKKYPKIAFIFRVASGAVFIGYAVHNSHYSRVR